MKLPSLEKMLKLEDTEVVDLSTSKIAFYAISKSFKIIIIESYS